MQRDRPLALIYLVACAAMPRPEPPIISGPWPELGAQPRRKADTRKKMLGGGQTAARSATPVRPGGLDDRVHHALIGPMSTSGNDSTRPAPAAPRPVAAAPK